VQLRLANKALSDGVGDASDDAVAFAAVLNTRVRNQTEVVTDRVYRHAASY
jgi:hypothetical protein